MVAFLTGLGTGYLSFHDASSGSSQVAPSTEGQLSDVRVACQVEGRDRVTVPHLIGKPLSDAAATARAAGLQLVGTGVSGGDPVGTSATVIGQKPPGGSRVPVGACIGFRTRP
jgi:hypothetical protein